MTRFKAELQRPASPPRATWSFLVLPSAASGKLPARGQVAVAGTINGQPFSAMLDPDGKGSHWLKVDRALRLKAGADVGDTVEVMLAPTDDVPEPRLPTDLREALAATPAAKSAWSGLTARQRHDWIFWITTAKRDDTRAKRIAAACDMLGSGKRRVCCFDRSGIYSKGLSAPEPAG
ncbi:hypothetical protein GCM10011521_21940 [Arenimonas soli]|uniref:DUF1905 domain-containing protein n=1 Tax=Arenimonas soli TaxID=2269504 RepID=A0ABQ1HME1_9GAMM|nr:YdeI/OmpD-associated family protein [Arenimonas soli]GGA83221.1 hypothetical protein GCM10011521_21940 [Arenimonas soli]